MDHAARQSVIALRIGDQLALGDHDRAVLYYTSLVAWVGCHVDAYEQVKWFGDDLALKGGFRHVDPVGISAATQFFRRCGSSSSERFLNLVRIAIEDQGLQWERWSRPGPPHRSSFRHLDSRPVHLQRRRKSMPIPPQLHHVALTVSDIDASVAWYTDLFGFAELTRGEHTEGGGQAVVVGKPDWSMFVVMNHHPTNKGETFDPTRTGLDHVGFTVADRATLVEWEHRLADKGVKHSPITDHDWGSSLNFRDPDEMQLQLVAFS